LTATESVAQPVTGPSPSQTCTWKVSVALAPERNGAQKLVVVPVVLLKVTLGPFNNPGQAVTVLDFVLYYESGTWDNNGGADWHVTVTGGGGGGRVYAMDGALDAGVDLACSNAGVNLYLDWNGSQLYAATQAARKKETPHGFFTKSPSADRKNIIGEKTIQTQCLSVISQ
jgi:hypothetical protein